MMPTIRVDDEVWSWLKQHAQPFVDTPNSVLRRIAGLDAPADKEGEHVGSAEPIPRSTARRSRVKDDHIPMAEFREPILLLLHRNGGQLDRQPAIRKLEEMLEGRLTDADRSDIDSGTIRWEKAAEWQLYNLRREGFVEPAHLGRGVWKLTAKGRELATRLAQKRRH
jgi:Mrr restriction endonuclease-like protein